MTIILATGLIALTIILIVCVIASIGVKATNNFKRLDIKVNESLSDIDVALQKRYSVLTKSFDVASKYAQFERETILKTIEMRHNKSFGSLQQESLRMDSAQRYLFALAENYPALGASAQFIELQKAIADTEEHLQAARRAYNANVSAFNQAIVVFPNSLFAGKYEKKPMFAATNTQDVTFGSILK